MRRHFFLFAAGAALGCSADGGAPNFNAGAMDAGATGDRGSATVNEVGALRDAVPLRDTGSSSLTPDSACMTTTADAQRRAANILLVLDRSGSMTTRTGNSSGPSRWEAATAGIRALLQRLDDETQVGLTLFPAPRGSTDNASTYATPVVPVAALRTSRAAILSALSSGPSGNTPMTCAMDGSRQYYQRFTGEGSRNIILITDGQPTNECTGQPALPPCNLLPPDLACIERFERGRQTAVQVQVAMARALTPSVRTFVAGTPEASDAFLSDLAFQGGSARTTTCRNTNTCHYSLREGSFEADIAAALEDIRGRTLTCEFAVNADPSRVDPQRVNVTVRASMSAERTLPRDVDHRDGWDYSDGMRSIILYGPACDTVRTDPQVRVQILFGCPTITPG